MIQTPLTDNLDRSLSGDWEECYRKMQCLATRLEASLNSQTQEIARLREILSREEKIIETLRELLAKKV